MANNGMYVATSGILTNILDLQTVAENLANVNTVGFKENIQANATMEQWSMFRNRGGVSTPIGGMGNEVISATHYRNWADGGILHTGTLTDFALSGQGFFTIGLPNGTVAYTRDGSFTLGPTGTLLTQNGNEVLSTTGAPIVLAPGSFTVDSAGNVSQNGTVIAQIGLASFAQPNLLTPGQNNLFTAPAGVVATASTATVMQGYLEQSNVNIAGQISQMIQGETGMQGDASVLKVVDNMNASSVQVGYNQV